MNNRRHDRVAFTAAAALLFGVSTAVLAQSPSTVSGQNSTSSEESKNLAKHKLQDMGLTNIKLKELKHGWSGTAVKDGKPVKVELTESGDVRIR
jgi:hypothetical protein